MCVVNLNFNNIDTLENGWNEILNEGGQGIGNCFWVQITCNGSDKAEKKICFKVMRHNLYVHGVGSGGRTVDFNDVNYNKLKTVVEISIYSIRNMIDFFKDKFEDMKQICNNTQWITLAIFLISEAARFQFIREAIRSILLEGSKWETQKDYFEIKDWEELKYKINKRENYSELVTNYSGIVDNKQEYHRVCVSIVETQTYFYNKVKQGAAAKKYENLVKIGLLNEQKLLTSRT